jgi:hypothetical protein
MGFAHRRVSPRRELAPANARRRAMCPRPARRPDTHFLRMGREGAHGPESRAEGRIHAPGLAFSRRGSRRSAAAEANLRARWRSSVPSSFSLRAPRCRQRGFEYGAGVPVRNSVSRRRLPGSAFTFQPHQPPTPILSNRVRLEATNVPPAPRRETAAWQPRCFPPLGIDVHEARAYCVHRQVLRPRGRPFDRVPLPLEEGEFVLAVRRGRAFFYLTLLPDFDCVKQCLQLRRAPCGAPYRLFPA